MKKLYRSNTSKIITGVCGGLANYLNINPKIVRVLFLAGLFFGIFPAIIVYTALAIIINPDPVKIFDKKEQTNVIDVEVVEKKSAES